MADLNMALGLIGQIGAGIISLTGASSQAQSIRTGGEIAARGSELSAGALRQSAISVAGATDFNLSIDALNTNRKLSAISRQRQRTIGRQLTQQAATGIAVGSKSYLQLRNESADIFNQAMLQTKLSAENNRRSRLFESQITQINLENQARAAEFRAQAERISASNAASEVKFQGTLAALGQVSKVARNLPTLLNTQHKEK
jgi:hypothetical protein